LTAKKGILALKNSGSKNLFGFRTSEINAYLNHTEQHTDEQLLLLVKEDDNVAFRKLFDRFYQQLLGTSINMLKDKDLAKDVVQEVFLQIWKRRSTLNINSSVGGYLKRSVINRSLNKIRAKKSFIDTDHLAEKVSEEPSAVDYLEEEDLQKAMKTALDTLPDRCRTIFVMKRLEGMSQKEIAGELGISPKTVENQITKALKVLKESVKPFLNNSG